MPEKRRRPGSPKGQAKPAKRTLDPKFPDRLMQALEMRGITIPDLAPRVGCTRAVLHKYRNGYSRTIEALLLFQLADALEVSPRWLLTGVGPVERELSALQTIRRIVEATPRPHNQRRGETGFLERRARDD